MWDDDDELSFRLMGTLKQLDHCYSYGGALEICAVRFSSLALS